MASEQTTTTVLTTMTTMATESSVNLTFAADQGHTNDREKDRDTESENTIHLRILQDFTYRSVRE